MERRTFLRSGALLTTIAASGGITFCACTMVSGVSKMPEAPVDSYAHQGEKLIVDRSKINELKEESGVVKFSINTGERELKIIIANIGNGKFRVVENRCTHGDRELDYKHDKETFQCVSFGHSKYDLNGNVIGGPAPKAIKIYDYVLDGSKLIIDINPL